MKDAAAGAAGLRGARRDEVGHDLLSDPVEREGLLHPRRAPNHYRDYDEQAVVWVRNIRRLLWLGFTAEDIRAFLPCLDQDIDARECPASVPFIAGKVAAMEEKITELTAIRDRLNAFLVHVSGEASDLHAQSGPAAV